MPTPSKTPRTGNSKGSAEWPALAEAGAGLTEAEALTDDPMSAPIEKLKPRPFSLKAEVKKRPALYIGLGALAVTGVAVFLGRGLIARAARPMVAKAVRPVLVRAVARHPVKAARIAAQHPRTTARVVAGLAEGPMNRLGATARDLGASARDVGVDVRDRLVRTKWRDLAPSRFISR